METVYYHLDARRVSTCDMASGETSPRCRSYAVLHKVEEKRVKEPGKVLDMESYRRKLETEEERWESVGGSVPDAPSSTLTVPAPARRVHRVCLFGLTLDAFATVAVLVMATVVVSAFLPFL